MNGFRFKTEIQIRFKDIDALGHVNNANHLTYLESARIEYFNRVVGQNINWSQKGIILAKAEIDYKKPVYFTDTIFVYTRCSRIGSKSFDLEYVIKKSDDSILAKAKTVMVCFDYKENTTIVMPDEWKNKLREFDKI